jgi:large subunit ribosomal protein L6
MSRVGKLPISIPSSVTVEVQAANKVIVKGPKGELTKNLEPTMKIEVQENEATVTRPDETKTSRSLHGLTRTLLANMVEGVSKGYEKRLEIVGVGYRAKANKNKISLTLGFSHPIEHVSKDPTVEFKMDDEANKKTNIIIVSGINKETVGEEAAKIRSYRKPEPYKGKGIKYIDEHIIRKAGKAAGAGAA